MRAKAWAVIVAGGLGALMLALCVGSGAPVVMSFDLPDAAWFEGMRSEREPGGRWTRSEARIAPGVVAVGEVEVRLVCDRPSRAAAATVVVSQGPEERTLVVGEGATVALLTARGVVNVKVAAEARREFGIRLRSLTVTPTGPGGLLPSPGLSARMIVGSALIAMALLGANFMPSKAAAATVLLWCLPVTLFGWTNPYVTVRLVDTLWAVAPLFAFVIAALGRSIGAPGVLLGVSSALLRLMLLFHPSWYYSDLEIHLGVTRALRDEGRIHGWMDMDALQQRFDLGRASVSGTMRPLPYPPFFHTLASVSSDGMEVALMKSLAVAAETATILLTLVLGRRLFDSESAGLMAGLLLGLLPAELRELLRVSIPAILGRTLDLVALVWLVSRPADHLAGLRGHVRLGVWLAVCGLCYNASVVHFGLFIPLALLALALPPQHLSDARGLLAAAIIGGLLSLLFYGRYLLDIAFNVLGENRGAVPSLDWIGLATSLAREHGPIFVAALIAAPVCVIEAWRRKESRLLLAWILWVPLIVFVANLFPGPFGFFRRQFFAHPLFALLCARWAKAPSPVSRALVVLAVVWGILGAAAFIPGVYLTHSGRIGD